MKEIIISLLLYLAPFVRIFLPVFIIATVMVWLQERFPGMFPRWWRNNLDVNAPIDRRYWLDKANNLHQVYYRRTIRTNDGVLRNEIYDKQLGTFYVSKTYLFELRADAELVQRYYDWLSDPEQYRLTDEDRRDAYLMIKARKQAALAN